MPSHADDERREEALGLAQEIWQARAHLKALEDRFALLLAGDRSRADASPAAPEHTPAPPPRRGPLPPRPATSPPAKMQASPEDDFEDDVEDDENQDDNGDDETGSAAARVLAVFHRFPGLPVPIQDVVDILPDIDPKSIRTNAARFSRKGKLRHIRRGVYMYIPATNGGAP